MRRLWAALCGACLAASVTPVRIEARQHVAATHAPPLSVPYTAQTPHLCGGAALAMVRRYWGARDIHPEDFASLVNRSEGGIRTSVLAQAAATSGWTTLAGAAEGRSLLLLEQEIGRSRPVIVLIEDGTTRFHYVVVTGFTEDAVIFHDPARAPGRRMRHDRFLQAWDAAGRWYLLVMPTQTAVARSWESSNYPTERAVAPRPAGACSDLIQRHVALARERAFAEAEAGLETATRRCPDDPSGWQELAGLRFIEGRYAEAARVAAIASSLPQAAPPVFDLLGGARFLTGDLVGALDAWNRLDEPRIDWIEIQGLTRSLHPVVRAHLGLRPRTLITPNTFMRAARRLDELPTLSDSRLAYRPAADGTALVSATAHERRLMPTTSTHWALVGISAALQRDARLDLHSPLREAEQWTFAYRFAHRRPRGLFRLVLPSPGALPGLTTLDASWEGQTYESVPATSGDDQLRRQRLALTVSDWASGWLRWEGGIGWDRFRPGGRYVSFESRVTARFARDRGSVVLAAGTWHPVRPSAHAFTTASLTLHGRTAAQESAGLRMAIGLQVASRRAQQALWPVAGSSDSRGVLLRAHPCSMTDASGIRCSDGGSCTPPSNTSARCTVTRSGPLRSRRSPTRPERGDARVVLRLRSRSMWGWVCASMRPHSAGHCGLMSLAGFEMAGCHCRPASARAGATDVARAYRKARAEEPRSTRPRGAALPRGARRSSGDAGPHPARQSMLGHPGRHRHGMVLSPMIR